MKGKLLELATLFLKLGTIGFGGPAVHIATMEEEVVRRRGWMTRDHYLDLVGATNLIPGPNSTEIAIHVGYHRAGLAGLFVSGFCFILPATLLTAIFAWSYQQYGNLPAVSDLLVGITPSVLVIIFSAGWRLGRKALRTFPLLFIGLAVATASTAGFDRVACLFVGSFLGMIWLALIRRMRPPGSGTALFAGMVAALGTLSSARPARAAVWTGSLSLLGTTVTTPAMLKLALVFLKVGAILYGSGYVLFAYLESELVGPYDFTHQQLTDAIAVGQLTPGPIFSTATFVGFQIAGWPGAVVASIGIFLPSFLFVAVLNPIIPKLRKYTITGLFLDAVNAASIGLLISVAFKLTDGLLVDWSGMLGNSERVAIKWQNWLLAVMAGVGAFRYRVSPAFLVLGGALLGWLLAQV